MISSTISPVPDAPPNNFAVCIKIMVLAIPDINPPSTGLDMYPTNFPALKQANKNSQKAVTKVITGTICIASLEPAAIPRLASVPPTSAAGAASTPKTNCGDDDNSPKISTGKSEPYKPYTTGSPAT